MLGVDVIKDAPGAPSGVDGLTAYLLGTDCTDVLEFPDNTTARAAADTLRARHPGVHVDARYHRVHLRLKV